MYKMYLELMVLFTGFTSFKEGNIIWSKQPILVSLFKELEELPSRSTQITRDCKFLPATGYF